MKVLYTLLWLCIFSLPGFSADCNMLEKRMQKNYTDYTPAKYQANIQAVNNFYDSGCKNNFDKNYQLGSVAFYTSANSSDKAKYLQTAYNYFIKSLTDKGQYASQMALQLGFYYRDKNSLDNAIIWYQRAADQLRQATGSSGVIPAHMAEAYILKGDCSSKSFDLYRKALNNMVAADTYNLADEISQKMRTAQYYCNTR